LGANLLRLPVASPGFIWENKAFVQARSARLRP
jgi:hypothetical protein